LGVDSLNDIVEVRKYQGFAACNDDMRKPHFVSLSRKFPYVADGEKPPVLSPAQFGYAAMPATEIAGIVVLKLDDSDALSLSDFFIVLHDFLINVWFFPLEPLSLLGLIRSQQVVFIGHDESAPIQNL
jgi:hypothetical protein